MAQEVGLDTPLKLMEDREKTGQRGCEEADGNIKRTAMISDEC